MYRGEYEAYERRTNYKKQIDGRGTRNLLSVVMPMSTEKSGNGLKKSCVYL